MDTQEVLTRGVEKVLPDKEGLASLMQKRKIRLYLGIDPTGARLHLGHTIPLRKLQQFADLGHESILVVGTGTVLASDPSQRDTARPRITEKEIEENMKTWRKQAEKIVDFSKVKIMYNGDWLTKLTLKDIIGIASHISAGQLFKREMFQKRMERGDTVWFHEVLYPLLQGYDSVHIENDLEIGGTDQEFNMLVGRELLRKMKDKEKYVLTVPMITGVDGKQMSKTSGNAVWLLDEPSDMYGKLMSMLDKQIVPYMRLLTDIPEEELQPIKEGLHSNKVHPMEAKKRLAREIVKMYHAEDEAQKAQDEFERVFQEGGVPQEAPTYTAKRGGVDLVEALTSTGLAPSKSEARRLIEQGALEWNGEKVNKPSLKVEEDGTLRVGKYRFLRIITK